MFDVGPIAGVLESLLLDDWLDEGEGKRNGVLLILLPLSNIDTAIVIVFELVGFR